MADSELTSMLPKKARVLLGDSVYYDMPEPGMLSMSRMLEVLDRLDLEKVVMPLVKMLRGAEGSTAADLLTRIESMGGELLEAARPVLGRQVGPAIMDACIAVLDTDDLRKKLIGSECLDNSVSGSFGEDGTYNGCPEVRRWLKASVTPKQASHVITKALEMMDLVEAGGNLGRALLPLGDDPDQPEADATKPKTIKRLRKPKG